MKFLITALLVGSSVTAFAQPNSVGRLLGARGVVSVSYNGVVTNVTESMTLSNGSVVLNSATGSSSVALANGCNIELKPNQVLTINSAVSCSELSASVKTVGTQVVTVTSNSTPLLVGGGLIGGGIILRNVTKNKASGS